MKNRVTISEAEWQVMHVLWDKSPQTLMQIAEKLTDENWSITTIQTYLSRLIKKGVLTTKRVGKGFQYSPVINESVCQIEAGKNFISKVFEGSISGMVERFAQSGELTNEELGKLKAIIAQQEGKK